MISLKNTRYNKIADNHKANHNKIENAIVSFLAGGFIGVFGEIIIELLCMYASMSRVDASSVMIVIFIFLNQY